MSLGRPVPHWLSGPRTWFAMVLALDVAFWLHLEGASRAAAVVAILALPTRGQAYDRALRQRAGTAIGVAAALVIAGPIDGNSAHATHSRADDAAATVRAM